MSKSHSAVEYLLALFIRHWSANMTVVHERMGNWPGFGYSDDSIRLLKLRPPFRA